GRADAGYAAGDEEEPEATAESGNEAAEKDAGGTSNEERKPRDAVGEDAGGQVGEEAGEGEGGDAPADGAVGDIEVAADVVQVGGDDAQAEHDEEDVAVNGDGGEA